MGQAALFDDSGSIAIQSAAAALASGELIQLDDGRAAYVDGLNARAAGDAVNMKTEGIVDLTKTAALVMLPGMMIYWDRSANAALITPASGDFYAGLCVKDAAAGDATVRVDLNVLPNYLINWDGSDGEVLWTHEATDGSGVVAATTQTRTILAFDAVAEVAQAALFPTLTRHHAPVADGPILHMRLAIFDIGDDGSLDITFGLANGSHATDFDSVTEAVVFHLDGNALAIFAESDDGTTEVAATDTTVVAVDDAYTDFVIDARNLSDIQLYIDGVNVLPASVFKLAAATGPIFPIVHLEKTSNDVVADVRVEFIRFWTTDSP